MSKTGSVFARLLCVTIFDLSAGEASAPHKPSWSWLRLTALTRRL